MQQASVGTVHFVLMSKIQLRNHSKYGLWQWQVESHPSSHCRQLPSSEHDMLKLEGGPYETDVSKRSNNMQRSSNLQKISKHHKDYTFYIILLIRVPSLSTDLFNPLPEKSTWGTGCNPLCQLNWTRRNDAAAKQQCGSQPSPRQKPPGTEQKAQKH